ncbi:hypothetical protein J7F01_37225 [Streptomyces sp. ISL-22]|uniref:hypothetical protein n=1 Tax=unclassified Streptomyces TaxID=2593676 RepID=UPI001BE90BD2|nr:MULTISPECIES: hypothetical protein [unclassified Streptomyces]MBT2419033.1 hypothetical protein [Streptomyces sp. ISL-24]MBT2437682.1 hypothetical protein [Streptomyces sp. ISL-22]
MYDAVDSFLARLSLRQLINETFRARREAADSFYACRPGESSFDIPDPQKTGSSYRQDRDFPYKVSDSDPAQVVLLLHPGQRDVRFTVEVEWVSDGEHGSETLDNHGQGYRVMGQGDLPRYYQELE